MTEKHESRFKSIAANTAVITLTVSAIVIGLGAIYWLRQIILIMVFAGLFAYFLYPPYQWLLKRMHRNLALLIVFVAFFLPVVLGIIALVPIIIDQTQGLAKQAPSYINQLEEFLARHPLDFIPQFDMSIADMTESAYEYLREQVPNVLSNVWQYGQSFLSTAALVLVSALLIPIITFYLLMDIRSFKRTFLSYFSENKRNEMEKTIIAINHSISGYIFSRVILALMVSISTAIVLWLLGIPFSLFFAVLIFITEFIPAVGAWISFTPILLLALSLDPIKAVVLLIWLAIVQVAENYLVGPKLMGDSMDLHPLTVIIAMLIGGSFAGVAGVLVAVPISAVIKAIVENLVLKQQDDNNGDSNSQAVSA
jgi:predicted PurR-regulated permease PerM